MITVAGNDPKVARLVHITAFAPEKGESAETLIQNPPPGAPVPPIKPVQDGFLYLDRSKFAASFAADVDPEFAALRGDSQVPLGSRSTRWQGVGTGLEVQARWYLISADGKMFPPEAQRATAARAGSTVVEVKGSYAVYVSQPQVTADLIEQAADGSGSAMR